MSDDAPARIVDDNRSPMINPTKEDHVMTDIDVNLVCKRRAIALLQSLAPALAWIRDHKGVEIDASGLCCAAELESIAGLAVERRFLWSRTDTGEIRTVDVADIPEAQLVPLRAYLGELPGYDLSLPFRHQMSAEPARQHGYVLLSLPENLENCAA
jgi:intracellular multiplication protein IcmO